MNESKPDFAYYYPAPYWTIREVDRLKNLLLFFDGICILLPRYMAGREVSADPYFAGPLEEMGLLKTLEPETFIDQQATESLITTLTELITSGSFERLDNYPKEHYQELSTSRLGSYADPELSRMIIDELLHRGLARPSEDGVSVPLHPAVRMTVLVLLSQLCRDAGRRAGMNLHPATTNRRTIDDLLRVLSLPVNPSAGHLVMLDLETVGVDLRHVPLDDILEFRKSHGEAYRSYARNVREQVRILGLLEPQEREDAIRDRQAELKDAAEALRATALQKWRNPSAFFALSAAGAGWMVTHGHDPIGALLALLGAGFSLPNVASDHPVSAYSYVFKARHTI
jgi:hypothetical protein